MNMDINISVAENGFVVNKNWETSEEGNTCWHNERHVFTSQNKMLAFVRELTNKAEK